MEFGNSLHEEVGSWVDGLVWCGVVSEVSPTIMLPTVSSSWLEEMAS